MLAASCFVAVVSLAAPGDAPDLPVVVLVGDSIRLGYAPTVIARLDGQAKVVSPEANGGDSANVLAHLDEWVLAQKPAVVHFNAGLHDLKRNPKTGAFQVPLDRYETNLRAIVERLEKESTARVIFATTTPVIDERHNAVKDFQRRETDVEAYNEVARKVMAGSPIVVIDDLFTTARKRDLEKILTTDGVHFTAEGSEALGQQAARVIEAALDDPIATHEAVCIWADRPPKIDGVPDEAIWLKARRIEAFPAFWAGQPSDIRTVAWLVWDTDALYFTATMADDELWAAGTKRNDRLWEGDVFELFFRPREDRPAYYEFQVNPRGVLLELAFPRRGIPYEELAKGPPRGMTAALRVGGTLNDDSDVDVRWTIEGRIPWTAFAPTGGAPTAGDVWRFALCRYDYGLGGKDPVLMSSAPLRRPDFHRTEDYGRLRFEGPDR